MDSFIQELKDPAKEYKRQINGLRCKACGDDKKNVDGSSMRGITKLWFLPHLLDHFKKEHPGLDLRVDMLAERHDLLRALCVEY